MRYRPFGSGGQAVSALTLSLSQRDMARGPEAACELVYSALEAGINSYRLETADPVLAEVLGEALRHVDRKLVQVSLTLGAGDGRRGSQRDFSGEGMTEAIDRALRISGLAWFDVVILDEPGEHELPQTALNALKALRANRRVRLLGVSGDGEVMDAYVSTGAFDVLSTPYHVNSEWRVRNRIRTAREQDMSIFVHGWFPEEFSSARKAAQVNLPKKKGLFGFGGGRKTADHPLAGAGTFAFLHRTSGWPAETICLAYVLTDPGVSSAVISPGSAERLAVVAEVPDRDMPPGLSAQIEMARVAGAKAA
ncbi:MAG: aldo/keto reductase [Alphaproteobacteria bacterium]|nr:aldo/keto reductase [Alphaproteobacteria bacterium]MBU1525365.1 aldo/keto reductase [Alphaproteobacteria bacterium]MBU2118091.1 aldo/keto reductase [Alphaproteobacteria bacterium]MBU2352483.1 aldo/keto reductase [Alphaproteobacteria bacterium]MBU2382404.1 aldo/keto reductase [Alphaproteobacteria bacterium]